MDRQLIELTLRVYHATFFLNYQLIAPYGPIRIVKSCAEYPEVVVLLN